MVNAWHYRVVDIKFARLELDRTGHASSEHLAFMAQVLVYSEALGLLQGYTPPSGNICLAGAGTGQERSRNCLDRLARVDLDYATPRGKQSLRHPSCGGINWMRACEPKAPAGMSSPRPTVVELRPNMSNTKDQPWHLAKRQDIAGAQGELTQLWQVSAVTGAAAANAAGFCAGRTPPVPPRRLV